MTLIDTNVLSDLWSESPWREWSPTQMKAAAAEGPLLINDIVFAELSALFEGVESTSAYVLRFGLQVERTPRPALFASAQAHRRYRKAKVSRPPHSPTSSSARTPRRSAARC